MTFTNLEKYEYSKKCLKQQRQPPLPLPSAKSKVFSRRKFTWLGYGCNLQLDMPIQQIE